MSEEKPGAKQEMEDARAHEEEAAKRASHEQDDIADDADQPKPAGPMGGANLGGAS